MEKLRNELLGAPERHSKIQYLCPVQDLKLKATHTSERLVNMDAGLTHQCLYFEQPHTFEQILFIQTAEPALVGHA